MVSRYKQFLDVLKQFPINKKMKEKCIGNYVQEQVKKSFKYGESTQMIGEEAAICDRKLESLKKIGSDYYKNKYCNVEYGNRRKGISAEKFEKFLEKIKIEKIKEGPLIK